MGLTSKLRKNELARFSLTAYLRNRKNGVRIERPPVFIIGCGHSGTTMLRHLLGMHQNLYAPPYESRLLFHSPLKIWLAKQIWSLTAISQGKRRWIEKTPSHVHHLGKLFHCFPEAKVLVVIRDGRNVAMSLYERWGDVSRSIRRWIDDNEATRQYWDHPQVMKVSYEALAGDFEPQLRGICDFIGEPFDENLLTFVYGAETDSVADLNVATVDGNVTQRRTTQLRSGLLPARDRWKQEMSDEQKERFKELAGDLLIEYGYAADNNW